MLAKLTSKNQITIHKKIIEQFPDVIVARMFGFGIRDLLEFDGVDIADVNMKQLFDS